MYRDKEFLQKLDGWVEVHRQEVVRDIIDLIGIKSVSEPQEGQYPFGQGCAKALDHMLEKAGALGLGTENHGYYCGTCTLPGQGGGRSIGIFCHLDVVPEGAGWTGDPYKAYLENEYIVGRGSSDNKGPAIGALYALRFLRENGIRLQSDVRLVYGCAEEIGMYDMDYYTAHITPPDFSLVPDGPFSVCYAEKGRASYKTGATVAGGNLLSFTAGEVENSVAALAEAVLSGITPKAARSAINGDDIEIVGEDGNLLLRARGTSKHTAAPEGSVDAIHKLATALAQSGLLTPPAHQVVEALAGFTADYNGRGLDIAFADRESGPLTHVCSLVRCDGNSLSVTCDIRYPISVQGEELARRLDAHMGGKGFARASFEDNPPNRMPKDHPFIPVLCDIVNGRLGTGFPPFVMAGGTYARKLPNAVGFGPGRPDIKKPFPPGKGWGHQSDEGVRVQGMLDMIRVYVPALLALDALLQR